MLEWAKKPQEKLVYVGSIMVSSIVSSIKAISFGLEWLEIYRFNLLCKTGIKCQRKNEFM